MKYKLINLKTKEDHICEKVTIDGMDYYVSDKTIKQNDKWFDGTNIRNDYSLHLIDGFDRKVIATNNPNIDIPKVVDEVDDEQLAEKDFVHLGYKTGKQDFKVGFVRGHRHSQETHSFSEEDMIEFKLWCDNNTGHNWTNLRYKSTKELLQLWKQQQPKKVYYNE